MQVKELIKRNKTKQNTHTQPQKTFLNGTFASNAIQMSKFGTKILSFVLK